MINRQTVVEALILITASILVGFAYTFVTKQGLFSEKNLFPSASTSNLEMIPIDQARLLFESRSALFIDSRHDFEYKMGHISGAINIALDKYDIQFVQLESIPKGKLLVTYCDGTECNSSIELAVKLMEAGFSNVKVFFGGWQEWSSANLPTEK